MCNCSCNECTCCKQEEEYEEFVPNKEYPVGGFFKIGNEVFKVVKDYAFGCKMCDIYQCTLACHESYCESYRRKDNTSVYFILYDTLDDDEL